MTPLPPIQHNDIAILIELGLTLSQAKTYLVLVQLGSSQIGAISKATQIRREHLYRTLHNLEEIGLVEKAIEPATKFSAIPLNEALSMLLKRKQKNVSILKTKTRRLIEKFEKKRVMQPAIDSIDRKLSKFVLISNRERSIKTLEKYFENAKTQICLMNNWKGLMQLWQYYKKTLKDALDKGVKIYQITELSPDKNQLDNFILLNNIIFKNPLFKIKYIPEAYSNFWIIDNKILVLGITEKGAKIVGPALISTDETLLKIAQHAFNAEWKSASVSIACITNNKARTEITKYLNLKNTETYKLD